MPTQNRTPHAGPLDTVDLREKGWHAGALTLTDSVVIGLASTAPAYSLAATLGYVVLAVGESRAGRRSSWRSSRCCSSRSPTASSTARCPTAARRSPGAPRRSGRGSAGWAAGRVAFAGTVVPGQRRRDRGVLLLRSLASIGIDRPRASRDNTAAVTSLGVLSIVP